MPSIKSAVDIIRQGRCTLVTTIQMYQILALNCLISAYSLSVLHLDGIKYGDKQMTCLGILMSISFVTISRSKPLQKLSSVTPLKSVFHPALFLSLLGQFAFHLLTLYMLVLECKKLVPEDRRPEFMKEFKPSLLNSVVFLVSAVQQVSVFVVNLKGPPFMGGLIENSPLLWSLTFTFVGTFMCASEYIPQLNTWLQLEPFPSAGFRNMVLAYLACDVVGSFLWDRLMLGIYAHSILRASLESTTKQDVWNIVRKLFWVVLIVYWVASQDYTEVLEEIAKASNSTEAVVASAASATVMQTIPVGAGAEL
jgi:cation-transporting ATPase 13A1